MEKRDRLPDDGVMAMHESPIAMKFKRRFAALVYWTHEHRAVGRVSSWNENGGCVLTDVIQISGALVSESAQFVEEGEGVLWDEDQRVRSGDELADADYSAWAHHRPKMGTRSELQNVH